MTLNLLLFECCNFRKKKELSYFLLFLNHSQYLPRRFFLNRTLILNQCFHHSHFRAHHTRVWSYAGMLELHSPSHLHSANCIKSLLIVYVIVWRNWLPCCVVSKCFHFETNPACHNHRKDGISTYLVERWLKEKHLYLPTQSAFRPHLAYYKHFCKPWNGNILLQAIRLFLRIIHIIIISSDLMQLARRNIVKRSSILHRCSCRRSDTLYGVHENCADVFENCENTDPTQVFGFKHIRRRRCWLWLTNNIKVMKTFSFLKLSGFIWTTDIKDLC